MKPIKELRQLNIMLLTLSVEASLDPQLEEACDHSIQDEWSSLNEQERFIAYEELLGLATSLANVYTITHKIKDPHKVTQLTALAVGDES